MTLAIHANLAAAWRWLGLWLLSIGQLLWPWLEKHTPQQLQNIAASLKTDEARIGSLDFSKDGNAALEEARRWADSETERRRGTDQKAATYLPLVAALIPLVLTLVSALWDKKAGSAPIGLNLMLLGLAVAYIASAGHWAFQELKVSVSHEPGLSDFEKSWGAPNPGQTLARQLLLHTRRNREGVNWKVTCIKMAHEFLLRAFLTFSLMLLVNICWYLAGLTIQAVWPASDPVLTTPKQAITAIVEIDSLASQLNSEAAWTVLDRDCHQRSAGNAALTFVPDPLAVAAKIPKVLRPGRGEIGLTRNARLECGGRVVGRISVWFVPTRLPRMEGSAGLSELLAISANDNVVGLRKSWPPTGTEANPVKLPVTLLQQAHLRRDGTGRPIVLTITSIGPRALRATKL